MANVTKRITKKNENIWKCDKKNKRRHMKTDGNMTKRINENI